MNVYLRNKCMVNDLNIGACNSSSCKMTKQRARERRWDSVHLVSLVHVHSIARCCRLYQLTFSCQLPTYKLLLMRNCGNCSKVQSHISRYKVDLRVNIYDSITYILSGLFS